MYCSMHIPDRKMPSHDILHTGCVGGRDIVSYLPGRSYIGTVLVSCCLHIGWKGVRTQETVSGPSSKLGLHFG